MKKLLSLLACCLFIAAAVAQQIDLNGRVSIHNSGYRTGQIEYVSNVFVKAPFAGETSTDSEGKFQLTFHGIANGTVIKVVAEKADLEVVNTRDLEQVVLGQKSRMPIYLAPKGSLAKAQTELYKINAKALYANHNALIKKLQGEKAESDAALVALEQKWGREIGSVGEAIELLTERLNLQSSQLPDFALEMAAKNLDFASALYIEAYEKMAVGDAEGALAVLSEAALEDAYTKALAAQEKGQKLLAQGDELLSKSELQLDQLIESYRLKASAHLRLFEYKKAIAAQEKVIEILQVMSSEAAELGLAYAYDNLAESLRLSGDLAASLDYQLKSVKLVEKILPDGHPSLIAVYRNAANAYRLVGALDQALAFQKKAIATQAKSVTPRAIDEINNYNGLALILKEIGDLEGALNACSILVDLVNKTPNLQPVELVAIYSNLGSTYQQVGRYRDALAVGEKAVELIESTPDIAGNPDYAVAYSNHALSYKRVGNYEQAIAYQQKAIALQEPYLDPTHPALLHSRDNLAGFLRATGQYEEALKINKDVVAKVMEHLPPTHPLVSTALNNISATYYDIGDYPAAEHYAREALRVRVLAVGPDHYTNAILYNNLAQMLKEAGALEKALVAQRKAVSLDENNLPPNHPELAESYHNLAGILLELGQVNEAMLQQQKAIQIFEAQGLSNNKSLAAAYGQMTRIHIAMEDYFTAAQYSYKNLAISRKLLNGEHPSLALAYHRHTTIMARQNQLDSAIIYENRAYDLLSKVLPNEHNDVQVMRQTLAYLYYQRGVANNQNNNYHGVIADMNNALAFGSQEPFISCMLCRAYYSEQEFETSVTYLERCYGSQLIDRAIYLANRSMLYTKMGDLPKAKLLLDELSTIDGADLIDYHRAAGLYYAAKGEYKQSITNLEAAARLGYRDYQWLNNEAAFTPLKALPAFQQLLISVQNETH